MIQFSNPRLSASFTDWPLGGGRRGPCFFNVRTEKRGARVERVTTGKPKYTTYGTRCCLVDGSNGRTYILQESKDYGRAIRVVMSDLMHDATGDLGTRTAYFRSDVITSDPNGEDAQKEHAMFRTLLALLDQAHASV
jgi:hypothetical protein